MDNKQIIPVNHIAFIMDGNSRWAEKKKLDTKAGHKAGAENAERVVEHALKRGIKHVTLYAFSTENWRRPPEEVSFLFGLVEFYLDRKIKRLGDNGVRLKVIGRRDNLDPKLAKQIDKAEETTASNDKLVLNLAFNYGGRAEIIDACKNLLSKQGALQLENLSEKDLARFLYNHEMPDPDIVVRTSGVHRLSNFLLWQTAYSELFFVESLWPDFNEEEFDQILIGYQQRKRNYGGR